MSSYTEGQVHQLANALERAGFTADDLRVLGQSNKLPDVLKAIRGHGAVDDLGTNPSVSWGRVVVEHSRGGKFEWDPSRASLYLSRDQQDDKNVRVGQLREELAGKQVANANVLDYLLAHPELIPYQWIHRRILFSGTLYRYVGGSSYVRCLYFSGIDKRWTETERFLGDVVHGIGDTTLLLAA